MAHYQYTQEKNVAFTSCKRKVVKLLKPANEAEGAGRGREQGQRQGQAHSPEKGV